MEVTYLSLFVCSSVDICEQDYNMKMYSDSLISALIKQVTTFWSCNGKTVINLYIAFAWIYRQIDGNLSRPSFVEESVRCVKEFSQQTAN